MCIFGCRSYANDYETKSFGAAEDVLLIATLGVHALLGLTLDAPAYPKDASIWSDLPADLPALSELLSQHGFILFSPQGDVLTCDLNEIPATLPFTTSDIAVILNRDTNFRRYVQTQQSGGGMRLSLYNPEVTIGGGITPMRLVYQIRDRLNAPSLEASKIEEVAQSLMQSVNGVKESKAQQSIKRLELHHLWLSNVINARTLARQIGEFYASESRNIGDAHILRERGQHLLDHSIGRLQLHKTLAIK